MIQGIGIEGIQACWHLADPNSWLFNNAFLGKGWARTVSSLIEQFGPGFTTPYQVSNSQPEKEAVWERIRLEAAPHSPSRMGSFYLFESEADADAAQQMWFADHQKIKVQAVTFPPPITTLHRADSKWLNRPQAEWENAAREYWHGAMTPEPMIELVAHGSLFFPGWEHPPFGMMIPNLPEKPVS